MIWWVALAGLVLVFNPPSVRAEDDDRTQLMIEALSRLKGQDLEANPTLKTAVLKVLEQVKGKPAFVEIVRDFKLKDQNPALLAFALQHPTESAAVEALRTLLDLEGAELLRPVMEDPARSAPLIEPLGNTTENKAAALLLPLVTDSRRDVAQRRNAVRALAKTHTGASGVLKLARDGQLPNDIKLIASMELNSVRWPAVKAEAAQLLPLPAGKGNDALPPVAELVRRRGDPRVGAAVFRRPEVNCIGCHKVGNEGTDFGPALSEIGTKLAREAIIESILDPSAGISFGFEAWQITLKDGDEAFGLITSETADELVLKAQGGLQTLIQKADVAKREKQPLSVMPAGLQTAMTTQEFVDLIEYLASLKKAP
jgi:putative heme-binding domain-containing protein